MTTTRRDRLAALFPDLARRRFQPDAPDTLWYGDVTIDGGRTAR